MSDSFDLPLDADGVSQAIAILAANQSGVDFLATMIRDTGNDAISKLIADSTRLKRRLRSVAATALAANDKLVDRLASYTGLATPDVAAPPPAIPSGGGGVSLPPDPLPIGTWAAALSCNPDGSAVGYTWNTIGPPPPGHGAAMIQQYGFASQADAAAWISQNQDAANTACAAAKGGGGSGGGGGGSGGGGSGGGGSGEGGGPYQVVIFCIPPTVDKMTGQQIPTRYTWDAFPDAVGGHNGGLNWKGSPTFPTWAAASQWVSQMGAAALEAAGKAAFPNGCPTTGGGGGGGGSGGGGSGGGGGGNGDKCPKCEQCLPCNCPVDTDSCPDITLETKCCPEPADWEQPGALLFSSLASDYRDKYATFMGVSFPTQGETAASWARVILADVASAIAGDPNLAYYRDLNRVAPPE